MGPGYFGLWAVFVSERLGVLFVFSVGEISEGPFGGLDVLPNLEPPSCSILKVGFF